MTDSDTDPEQAGVDQFDLTLGMEFGVMPGGLYSTAAGLEQAEAFDTADASTETLAEYVAALKALEDAAEEARKEVFEDALSGRVDEGETVGSLQKCHGSRRYVTDDAAAFQAVDDAGGDPTEVASVKASKLPDVLGEDADEFLGETTYSYFRRDE